MDMHGQEMMMHEMFDRVIETSMVTVKAAAVLHVYIAVFLSM